MNAPRKHMSWGEFLGDFYPMLLCNSLMLFTAIMQAINPLRGGLFMVFCLALSTQFSAYFIAVSRTDRRWARYHFNA